MKVFIKIIIKGLRNKVKNLKKQTNDYATKDIRDLTPKDSIEYHDNLNFIRLYEDLAEILEEGIK